MKNFILLLLSIQLHQGLGAQEQKQDPKSTSEQGYQTGHVDGYDDGYNTQYDLDYQQGFADGYQDGYSQGDPDDEILMDVIYCGKLKKIRQTRPFRSIDLKLKKVLITNIKESQQTKKRKLIYSLFPSNPNQYTYLLTKIASKKAVFSHLCVLNTIVKDSFAKYGFSTKNYFGFGNSRSSALVEVKKAYQSN